MLVWSHDIPPELGYLAECRKKAKENKRFDVADGIREAITSIGIKLIDLKDTTTWQRIPSESIVKTAAEIEQEKQLSERRHTVVSLEGNYFDVNPLAGYEWHGPLCFHDHYLIIRSGDHWYGYEIFTDKYPKFRAKYFNKHSAPYRTDFRLGDMGRLCSVN